MDRGFLDGRHRPPGPRPAYLHRRKSAHRDIKPTSLLIDSGRRVKIADFTDNGPLRLLRRYHRLHEPRADRHRPQPQGLRRLRRQHLELRPQNPESSSSVASRSARTSVDVSTEHCSCAPSATPIRRRLRPPPP
ncbi:unnamed protein product, partial [Musa acuminata var. zebrina]